MRDAPGAGGAAVGRRKAKSRERAPGAPAEGGRAGPGRGAEAFARGEAIRCYGTRGQLDEIRRRASTAGLPASAFLRNLALGAPIRPVYDLEAARGLLALEARLERVEAWLGRIAGRGASGLVVGAALAEARQALAAVRALADRA